jgi:D-serine dehydratase
VIDLQTIETSLVDDTWKGMPGGLKPIPLGDIGRQGWNVLREDLPLPLAILKESALSHNGQWMRRFLARSGAKIAPHGKTTMSPQLFARQLDDGAFAITIGTVQQLQVARRYGVDRVVMANQLVGARAIRYVLDEIDRDPSFDFYSLVDSVALVDRLAEAAGEARLKRPLQLIVEGGFRGGRTGCRELPEALAVAAAVKAHEPFLSLRGVGGYEGLIRGETPEQAERLVESFLDYLATIAVQCDRENHFGPGHGPVLLTAGGSTFYDIVARRFAQAQVHRPFTVLTRSGCYLTHDSGEYAAQFGEMRKRSPEVDALGPGLQAALEVWAYVQSRPEPEKVLLTAGKRDISFDVQLPRALAWFRPAAGATAGTISTLGSDHVVTGLNDQHCHLAVPRASPLQVGDMVALGISHPCTTFDKWQVMCIVNDDYDVVSAVRTFF